METHRLTRVAEQLGMSQPAVSAALQRLRHVFQDELFIRSHHGMYPTPHANRIYKPITSALDLIRAEVLSGREFDPSSCQRHFRILGGDYLEVLFIGSLLARIDKKAPDVSSQVLPLQIEGRNASLLRGDLDLAIHYTDTPDDDIVSEHIFEDRLVVVARKDHPGIRKNVTRNIFFSEKHITLLSTDDNVAHVDLLRKKSPLDRKVSVKVTNFSNMIPIALSTNNLCLMPEKLASWFQKSFPISYYDPPVSIPNLSIHLCWAKRFESDLAHAWFRSELKAVMNSIE